jgi:hypothetical protein
MWLGPPRKVLGIQPMRQNGGMSGGDFDIVVS